MESTRPRKSGSETGQRSEPIDHLNDLCDVEFAHIRSFQPLLCSHGGDGEELLARVNIVEASGCYIEYMDLNKDFLSIASLIRDDKKSYEFRIASSILVKVESGLERKEENVKGFRVNFKEIKSIRDFTDLRKSFILEFKKQDSLEIEFFNSIDAKKFCKKVRILMNKNTKEPDPQEKRPLNSIVQFKIPKRHLENSTVNTISSISDTIHDCILKKPEYVNEFYHKPARIWTPNDVEKWLKYVFVQPRPLGKIMTFFELLKSQDNDVLEKLKRYVGKGKKHNVFYIYQSILEYEREKINPDRLIETIVKTPFLRRAFKREIVLIRKFNGMFCMPFARILDKKFRHMKRKKKKMEETLDNYKNRFMFGFQRCFWDYECMRDFILCQLLFQKPPHEVISIYEDNFHKFVMEKWMEEMPKKEEKKKEEEVEGETDDDDDDDNFDFDDNDDEDDEMNILKELKDEEDMENDEDDDDEDDRKPDISEVPPRKYLEYTKNYSKSERCDIHRLSFLIFLKCRECNMKIKREKLVEDMERKKKDIDEVKHKLDLIQLTRTQKGQRRREFMDRMVASAKNPDEVDSFNTIIERIEKEIAECITEEDSVERTLNKKVESIKRTQQHIIDVNHEIDKCTLDMGQDLKDNEKYVINHKKAWRKFLKDVLEFKAEQKGYVELVAKLVLSTRQRNPQEIQNQKKKGKKGFLGKMGDNAMMFGAELAHWFGVKPDWFEWGLFHSSVLLGSLQIHWFQNGFVFLNQLSFGRSYNEVFCVDANCPLLLNQKTIYRSIENLAIELVKINVNHEYEQWKFIEKKAPKPSSISLSEYDIRDEEAEGEEEEEEESKEEEEDNIIKMTDESSSNNENVMLTLNCQEFSKRVLKSLRYTDFHEETKEYQKTVIRKLCNDGLDGGTQQQGGEEEDRLRFIVMNKKKNWNFEQKFEKVLNQERYKPKVEKFGRVIYFRNHRDLDEFYIECRNIDKFFKLNYPGVHQLLKGFDRALWMRAETDQKNEKFKPGRSCPFNPRKTGYNEEKTEDLFFFNLNFQRKKE